MISKQIKNLQKMKPFAKNNFTNNFINKLFNRKNEVKPIKFKFYFPNSNVETS